MDIATKTEPVKGSIDENYDSPCYPNGPNWIQEHGWVFFPKCAPLTHHGFDKLHFHSNIHTLNIAFETMTLRGQNYCTSSRRRGQEELPDHRPDIYIYTYTGWVQKLYGWLNNLKREREYFWFSVSTVGDGGCVDTQFHCVACGRAGGGLDAVFILYHFLIWPMKRRAR